MIAFKTFLTVLTRYCDEQKINHAWARDYGTDITAQAHGDIDILVEYKHIAAIIRFIEAWPDLKLVGRLDHPTNTQIFIHGIQNDTSPFFCLDIHHHLSFKGLPYLNVSSVLLRAEPASHGLGNQPHPIDLALIYLFGPVLKHGKADTSIRTVYYTGYKTDRLEFEDILENLFGFSGIKRIDGVFHADDTTSLRQRLKLSYITRQIRNQGLAGFLNWISYYCQTILRRFHRRDIRMVVMGTDGSGKTHFIKSLLPSLKGLRSQLVHAHLLPVMPWQSPPDSNIVNSIPHGKPDRGWILSNAKLIYYFLLYWIDAIWPHKGSCVVVYDRYMTDLLVDPRRFRFNGSAAFARFIVRHLPKIDLYVWLKTPVALAFSRKPELPLSVMQSQFEAYSILNNILPNTLAIDTTLSVEASVTETTDTLSRSARPL